MQKTAVNKYVTVVIKSPPVRSWKGSEAPAGRPHELIDCHLGSRGCSGGCPGGIREHGAAVNKFVNVVIVVIKSSR